VTGEIITFPDDEINATRRRFLSGGAAVMAAPIVPATILAGEGPTDPVILLIAEEYRWRSLACAVRGKADKAWFAIRSGPADPGPPGLYDEIEVSVNWPVMGREAPPRTRLSGLPDSAAVGTGRGRPAERPGPRGEGRALPRPALATGGTSPSASRPGQSCTTGPTH